MSLLLALPLTVFLATTLSAFLAEIVHEWHHDEEAAAVFVAVAALNAWLLLAVIGVA